MEGEGQEEEEEEGIDDEDNREWGRSLYTDCFSAQHLVPGDSHPPTAYPLGKPTVVHAMNVARTDIKQKTHWWLLRPGVGLEDRK